MKKLIIISFLSLFPMLLIAQNGNGSGDFLDNIGKIYVVVGVLLILFISIVLFLVYLERRVAALEAEEEFK